MTHKGRTSQVAGEHADLYRRWRCRRHASGGLMVLSSSRTKQQESCWDATTASCRNRLPCQACHCMSESQCRSGSAGCNLQAHCFAGISGLLVGDRWASTVFWMVRAIREFLKAGECSARWAASSYAPGVHRAGHHWRSRREKNMKKQRKGSQANRVPSLGSG